jgi:hypothetical protein
MSKIVGRFDSGVGKGREQRSEIRAQRAGSRTAKGAPDGAPFLLGSRGKYGS